MNALDPIAGRQLRLSNPESLIERLHETAAEALAEATIDREQRLVRNVALLGPESKNGYRYTAEAMQQAVPLYEGRPVFVDHPQMVSGERSHHAPRDGLRHAERDGYSPPPRSIRDYAGKVLNPRFENGRVRGDLQLLEPNAGWLLSLIEGAPSDIGMSHVVLARRNSAGDQVEKIERVLSVDIVAFPATTMSFQEAETDLPFRTPGDRCPHCGAAHVDTPTSFEKASPEVARGAHATPLARQALIAAVRGE